MERGVERGGVRGCEREGVVNRFEKGNGCLEREGGLRGG